MNPHLLLSCAVALAFAVTGHAQNPGQRPDQPPRPDSRPPSPMQHQQDGQAASEPRARLGHLMEAIQHLRAAGLNEPAENLEKMAREMREHLEREQRDGTPPDSRRRSFAPSMGGGGPPMIFGRMEEMQKEIRNLSSQVQELRKMMQNRGGDQQRSARQPDGPRDGDRRAGNNDGPPRAEQHAKNGEGHHDGDRDNASRNNPPGEPRNQGPRDEAKRDNPPRDDAKRDDPRRDGPTRDGERKDGARAETSSGAGRPSEADRERFMSLSSHAREKFIEEMRKSRDKMMNASPEERKKFAKELFERAESEDRAKGSDSSSVDDALRALDVKPPF